MLVLLASLHTLATVAPGLDTLSNALTGAIAGDTLLLQSGVFTLSSTLTSASAVLKSQHASRPKILLLMRLRSPRRCLPAQSPRTLPSAALQLGHASSTQNRNSGP